MALIFNHIVTEGLGDISYLIGDDTKGAAAVIDPRADVAAYTSLHASTRWRSPIFSRPIFMKIS